MRQVLGFARAAFPYVLVDLDRVLRPEQLSAVVQLDLLLLPMRLDIASLHSARRLIETLNRAGFHDDRVIVVASRYGQSKELPVGKVEQALGLAIRHHIPDAPADINLAGNKGVPVVLERPRRGYPRASQSWPRPSAISSIIKSARLVSVLRRAGPEPGAGTESGQNGHGKVASLFGKAGLVGAGGRQRGDP